MYKRDYYLHLAHFMP